MASGRRSTNNRFAKANQSLVSGNKSNGQEQTEHIAVTPTVAPIEDETENIIVEENKSEKKLKDLIKKNSKSRGIPKTIYFDADQYKKIEKFSKQLAKSENSSKPSFSKALKIILDDYFG